MSHPKLSQTLPCPKNISETSVTTLKLSGRSSSSLSCQLLPQLSGLLKKKKSFTIQKYAPKQSHPLAHHRTRRVPRKVSDRVSGCEGASVALHVVPPGQCAHGEPCVCVAFRCLCTSRSGKAHGGPGKSGEPRVPSVAKCLVDSGVLFQRHDGLRPVVCCTSDTGASCDDRSIA